MVNGIDDIILTRDTENDDIGAPDGNQELAETPENVESVNLFDQLTSAYSDPGQTISDGSTSTYVEKIDGDVITNHIAASMRSTNHDHQAEGVYFQ